MFGAIRRRMKLLAGAARQRLGMEQTYYCGELPISLPADHLLPVYSRVHRLYDRFLPLLCEPFSHDDWIIDIGANCGDTLAAILTRNGQASCLCIEGDSGFFRFLRRNIAALQALRPAARAIALEALVGTGTLSGTLAGKHGTKALQIDPGAGAASPTPVRWLSIETILAELPATAPVRADLAASGRIRLIKTDVDGFDYDVLKSAGSLLDDAGMLLYFECCCESASQRQGFAELFDRLLASGFCQFAAFDNFGNHLLNTDQIAILQGLIDYVLSQNEHHATRTIYYFDVLAWKLSSHQLATAALDRYRQFINAD
jgi:FkbM family methyltransferase